MRSRFIFGIEQTIKDTVALGATELGDRVGGNSGNLAFHFAVDRIVGGFQPTIGWYAPPEAINRAGAIGVMPCANQLGTHSDYGQLADSFRDLDVGLVALGLGAQGGLKSTEIPEIPEGTLRWVREIADRAPSDHPNIGVRGAFTKEVLAKYGFDDQAVVLGCPSLFINDDPALGQSIAARASFPPERIAVCAGHPRWTHLSRLEASLARLMVATGGTYIVQSPVEMIALGRGRLEALDEDDARLCRDYACPELTLDEFSRWVSLHARVYFDVSVWMEELTRYDLVIGSRIHGVMLALQAGVPGLCIAHDSRTRELCETMMVPFVMSSDVVNGIGRDQLESLFDFDADAFDRNRARLAQATLDFLEQNAVAPDNDRLRHLAQSGTVA